MVLSGAGGLIYQLAWTRQLASVTSATYTAQAVVLAVFMAGLGVGACFGGRLSKLLQRPLYGYAAFELAAAFLAALSTLLFPASGALREIVSAAGLSPAAAFRGQLTAVAVFLMFPTTLLGASLPLLIEQVDRDNGPPGKPETARFTSLLYCWNTLGAAAGCLLAGYATIEMFGLSRTIYCGAACAAGAAAMAFLIQGRAADGGGLPETARVPEKQGGRPAETGWVLGAAATCGFAGMGAEVLWTRLVSLVVLTTAYALAQVLAAVLAGIAMGAGMAAFVIRRQSGASSLLGTTGVLLAIGAAAMAAVPAALLHVAGRYEAMLQLASGPSPWSLVLMLVVALPSALLAAALPLLVAAIHAQGRTASAFGILYGANTAGAVAGSLAMGFLLLPLLGSRASGIALLLAVLSVSALLMARAGASMRTWGIAAAAAATSSVLACFADIPRNLYERRLDAGWEIMELAEGRLSDVMVAQDSRGVRRLWINSSWVAGTEGGHRLLGHLPALFVERPRRGLGIALGTGQTFASVLRHGVRELHCVELDAGVIELSRRWFARANDGLFDKPGVVLHHDDGRAFMRASRERYDLVILEPLQAWTLGTTNLYTREFYEEAEAILAPGGVLAQWIPFYGQSVRDTRAMVRAAVEVFPNASLWLDDHDGILLLQAEPLVLSPGRLGKRIHDRNVRPELERNHVEEIEDMLSLFLLGPEGVRTWSEGVPILSDDHPFLEFSAARQLGTQVYRDILRSIIPELEDPVKYASAGDRDRSAASETGPLIAAGMIRNALLEERSLAVGSHEKRASALEKGLGRVPRSRLLRKRYSDLILTWAESEGRTPDGAGTAAAIYRRGLEHAPGLGEIAVELAVLYGRLGDYGAARAALEQADSDPRVRDSVRKVRRRLESAELNRAARLPGMSGE